MKALLGVLCLLIMGFLLYISLQSFVFLTVMVVTKIPLWVVIVGTLLCSFLTLLHLLSKGED